MVYVIGGDELVGGVEVAPVITSSTNLRTTLLFSSAEAAPPLSFLQVLVPVFANRLPGSVVAPARRSR